MMNEQEITERLQSLGLNQKEMRAVMADVAQVIIAKATEKYLHTLPENERARIQSLSAEDLQNNVGSLPTFSQETFDCIHDEVWGSYFKSVA
jgi:ATP-dependent Lon protease